MSFCNKHTMKITTLILLNGILGVLLSMHAFGQLGAKGSHDVRMEKLLDDIGLKYQIDDDGDFKLMNQFDNGRSHVIFINSSTEKYNKLEIREIWSVAYVSGNTLSPATMRDLLTDNGTKKLGSWKIAKMSGNEAAVFYAQIAADCDQATLLSALQIVSQAADEMEAKLTQKDDL